METAGKVLLVSAVVLATVGLGALGLAKGIDRLRGRFVEIRQRDGVRPDRLVLLVSIDGTIVVNVFLRR